MVNRIFEIDFILAEEIVQELNFNYQMKKSQFITFLEENVFRVSHSVSTIKFRKKLRAREFKIKYISRKFFF
jgi:hypothetical protein